MELIWTYSLSERLIGRTIQIRAQLGSEDTAIKGMHGIFLSHHISNFEQPTIFLNILRR